MCRGFCRNLHRTACWSHSATARSIWSCASGSAIRRTARRTCAAQVMLNLWDLYQENGIELPYPQREVTLRNPEAVATGAGRAPDQMRRRNALEPGRPEELIYRRCGLQR